MGLFGNRGLLGGLYHLADGSLPDANPAPSVGNIFAHAAQQLGNALVPEVMSAVPNLFRQTVPAQYRWLGSSLAGDRTPLTEKNYSPAELAALAAVVARDQAAMPERAKLNHQIAQRQQDDAAQQRAHLASLLANPGASLPHEPSVEDQKYEADFTAHLGQAAQNRARMAETGTGAVGYNLSRERGTNYGSGQAARVGPLMGGAKMADPKMDALANTLGAFLYHQQPDGSVTIDDNYNWNASGSSVPQSLPGAFQRLTNGDLEALPAYLMPDRQHGRPVHVTLPANMFGFRSK